MYEELIKSLREKAEFLTVSDVQKAPPGLNVKNLFAETMSKAADAIEAMCEIVASHEDRQRWIPVTERLPVGGDDSGDICENVCLMLDDGTVSCGWMNGITKKVYFLNARDDFIIKAPITRVTHWMSLPEPPKEEKDTV